MKKRNFMTVSVSVILLALGLTGCQKDVAELSVNKTQAKEIAIERLGVSAQDVSYAVVNDAGNKDDPYYDVEVLHQGVVYRYSIDQGNGDVRKLTINDQNVQLDQQPEVPTAEKTEYIGLDRAKEIAFHDAGVSTNDVQKLDYEMDFAYGKYLYDIEFFANDHKYEYEIIADSGEIFEKNVDRVTVIEPTSKDESFIGVERAKEIALAHSEVKSDDALFDAVEWEMKNGSPVYEVEFKTANAEYDYYIHAVTGEVIRHSKEVKKEVTVTETKPDNNTNLDRITKAKAKEIALQHANVNEADAKKVEIELDVERGIEVYEVEFKVGNVEYDYLINAKSGEVINYSKEAEKEAAITETDPDNNATHDHLTAAEAKGIALRHAGINEADAKKVEIDLDFERGVEVYEVEFEVGNVEYNYLINAKTGKIIKAEKDYDD